jgi:hypothetical protein
LEEIEPTWGESRGTEFKSQDRERKILSKLRLEHLNAEENKLLADTCLEYQDIFYLPGDRLSSTGTALQVTRNAESRSRGTSEETVMGRNHRGK